MATTSKSPRKTAVRKSTRPAAKRPAIKKVAPTAAAKKAPVKGKAAKPKKPAVPAAELKVVRDGFTMPQADYDKIKTMKARCLKSGVEVKKSQLLRAGLIALEALPLAELLRHIATLSPVKAGRKKKKA